VRHPPEGLVIVAPADGTVQQVTRVERGVAPQVIKRGVPVPLVDLVKTEPGAVFRPGYLVGIYGNTFGVHVTRVPNHGVVPRPLVFNGPHMDMTRAETKIILADGSVAPLVRYEAEKVHAIGPLAGLDRAVTLENDKTWVRLLRLE
jgi:phosphatidylserine decarboxylase